ncbi:uncharacterized protein PAC_06237 [Phialocephala subalpina]|uniref:Fungal N-terminal domain-containing protein n=1 Tax=Phialocephala subalpina TaxID=576137 RepID=A0A1L7WUB7_9HELO|nr:uncharacterized protein PAC_06237 [Phialocephala subalpina]
MAEALGVGASVVAFIGLAGQVAQGAAYLYNFFGAIQDAPADVRSLAEELKVLSPILDDVRRHGLETASMRAAVEQCNASVEELKALVVKSKLTTTQPRTRKIWSQMSVGFRSEKFHKHTEKLERAKLALIPAQNEAMHHQRSKAEKTIQDSMSQLTLEHSVGVSKLSEASSRVEAELQNLPTHVTNHVTTEVSQLSRTLNNNHTTYTTMLTDVQNTSIRTEQQSQEINDAIRSLLGNSDISHIAALLQPALEKVVSDRIDAAMKEHAIRLEAHTSNSMSSTTVSHQSTQCSVQSSTGVTSLSQLSSTVTYSKQERTSKIIKFWFGQLRVTTSIVKSWQGSGNSKSLQKSQFVETKVTLIPSSWLLRKGVILTISHVVSGTCSPSVQFSLVPLMVLADDHPIVTLMGCGNLSGVRRLIESGQVHTSSLFPDGSNLLLRCMNTLLNRFVSAEQVGIRPFYPGRAELDMIEIAECLVEKGIETDIMDVQGSTNLFVLTDILYNRIPSSDPVYPRLEALGSSMLRASESSLLGGRDSDGFIQPNRLLEPPEDQVTFYRHCRLIAEGSTTDHGVLICLASLHTCWMAIPYATCDSHFISREYDTFLLMKTAIANKLWLAGDDHEEEMCFRLLYHSILSAFTRASSYTGILRASPYTISKDEAVRCIAEMLRFDEKIPSLALEFGSLTSCAAKWKVLDVWKFALERAGHHPSSVIGNDIWDSNSHLYDKTSGFVSIEGIVSMSADPCSGRVCLAVDESKSRGNWRGLNAGPPLPELENLTRDWTFFYLLYVHCEVYQLPAYGIELDDYQPGHVPTAKRRSPESQYNFQPTEDGGIEMFIDCCEYREPWDILCAEIEKEKEAFEKKSAEPEEQIQKTESGMLSKALSVGTTVLSAFV